MADLATYLEAEVMEWVFNGTSFDAAPSNIYVGLHTGDPSENGSDNEVTATDYTRASTAPGDWNVTGSGPTVATNANEIRFDTAQNSWGTISHVSLWDDTIASGSDNCLWQGSLNSNRDIQDGDRLVFPVDDFDADLD